MKTEKKIGEPRGDIGAIEQVLTLFQKIPIITPTKRTIQPGDAFADTALSSRGLKLSNSKPGCRVSALHFVVK